jgi:hypothetical protein
MKELITSEESLKVLDADDIIGMHEQHEKGMH